MGAKNAWGPRSAAHVYPSAKHLSAQGSVHGRGLLWLLLASPFSPGFKYVRWGGSSVAVPAVRAEAGSRVERRKPAVLVNLEVSGDVQEAGKDSVCISQLMPDHAAVTNAPRSTGSRTAGSRARAHAQSGISCMGTRTGTRTSMGSCTELDLALASGAGGEPGKLCTLSFSTDMG